MSVYDPKSPRAEEFINHEEVLASLDYAKENCHNEALIDEILNKARLRKGLSHREAAVRQKIYLTIGNAILSQRTHRGTDADNLLQSVVRLSNRRKQLISRTQIGR